MKCLYCQKRVLVFRLLGGGDVFCSEEHQNLYRQQMAESAIERILKMEAKPKAKLEAKPEPQAARAAKPRIEKVVHEEPAFTIDDERPPQMAGFRMGVVEPMDSPVLAAVALDLQPAILEAPGIRLTPIRLATRTVWCWTEPSWIAAGSADEDAPGLVTRDLSRIPQEAPTVALGFESALLPAAAAFDWKPMAEAPHLVETSAKVPSLPATLTPKLFRSRTPQVWTPTAFPLWRPPGAEGRESQLPPANSTLTLEAAPAVSMPYLEAVGFVTTWSSGRALRHSKLWRSRLDSSQRLVPILEIWNSGSPAAIRRPSASNDRPGRPSAATASRLFVAASLGTPVAVAGEEQTVRFPPGLEAIAAGPASAAAFTQPWKPARPLPESRVIRPEKALDLVAWTAWPESADLAVRMPARGTSAPGFEPLFGESPAGDTSAQLGLFLEISREGTNRTKSVNETRGIQGTPPRAIAPVVSVTSRFAFARWEWAPAAQVFVSRPRVEIRRPAPAVRLGPGPTALDAVPALPDGHLTASRFPRQAPPRAYAPPLALRVRNRSTALPHIGAHAFHGEPRELDLLARANYARGWQERPPIAECPPRIEHSLFATTERWPSAAPAPNRIPAARPLAAYSVVSGSMEAIAGPGIQQTPSVPAAWQPIQIAAPQAAAVLRATLPAAVVNTPVTRPAASAAAPGRAYTLNRIWGKTGDCRVLDPQTNRRDAAPRLVVHDLDCRTRVAMPPAVLALPSAGATCLAFRATDETTSAPPAQPVDLAAPVHLLAARPAALTLRAGSCQLGDVGWTGRAAAVETPARRRQFPASKPKMNRPRAVVPARPLTLGGEPGLWTSDAASLHAALQRAGQPPAADLPASGSIPADLIPASSVTAHSVTAHSVTANSATANSATPATSLMPA